MMTIAPVVQKSSLSGRSRSNRAPILAIRFIPQNMQMNLSIWSICKNLPPGSEHLDHLEHVPKTSLFNPYSNSKRKRTWQSKRSCGNLTPDSGHLGLLGNLMKNKHFLNREVNPDVARD
jgi:hypothetical protein